jgi:hypothetical protein
MAEYQNPFEGYKTEPEKTPEAAKSDSGVLDMAMKLTPQGMLPTKEEAAKVLQSATFGFGADVAGAIVPGADKKIRGLADMYDQKHPLAGLGLDLAVGAAQGFALPGAGTAGAVGKVLSNPLVRSAATGAAYGGLSGLGSGGSMEQRMSAAQRGATTGAVLGPLVHGVASAAGPVLSRAAQAMGLTSAEEKAKQRIAQALQKEGNLPPANAAPDARVADVSPGVTELTKRATRVSGDVRRQAQEAAQKDVEGAQGRIQGEKAAAEAQPPFAQQKQKLESDMAKLEADKNAAYDKLKMQVMPMSPELQKIMELPSVKEAAKTASAQWNEAVQAGLLPKPQWTPGKDLPMSGMDKLQRELARMREDAFKNKNNDLGKQLSDIHEQLIGQMKKGGYSFKSAYDLSAEVGAINRAKNDAYDWGTQFSKGLAMADRAKFNAMSPLEQQHARLGFVNGMEEFLTNPRPLTKAQLDTAAKALESPEIRAVAGNDYARAMARRFRAEAQRQKTSSEFASPVIQREEAEAGREATMGAYAVNKATGGIAGTMLGLASKMGMSEKEAKAIVSIATQPGGAQKLSQMGVDKKLVDKAKALARAQQFAESAFSNRIMGVTKTPSNAKE